MMRSLYSAVSGLQAHQTKMDVIGNNIANVNTTGFKKDKVTFQDLLSQTIREAAGHSAGSGGVNSIQIGSGVMIGAVDTMHTQGAVATTGCNTHLMIQGEGFFVLQGLDGEQYYTRAGVFSFDEEGYLVNSANGMYVLDDDGSEIHIADIENVKNISISPDGMINYIDENGDAQQLADPIALAKFANPAGLNRAGENLFVESNNSGAAEIKAPGIDGRGKLIANVLEMSNVDLSEEFVDMIVTQRGFQANSRTIRVSDEILQELINLKR